MVLFCRKRTRFEVYSQPKRSKKTAFLTSAFELSVWVIVANRLSLIGWWVCFSSSVTGTICRCPEITRKTNLRCLITALRGVTDNPWGMDGNNKKKRPETISAGFSWFFPCYHALISSTLAGVLHSSWLALMWLIASTSGPQTMQHLPRIFSDGISTSHSSGIQSQRCLVVQIVKSQYS